MIKFGNDDIINSELYINKSISTVALHDSINENRT